MNRVAAIAGTSLALIFAGTALVTAGPLDPAPGPIDSTFKTLSEIEPRTALDAKNTPGDATHVLVITKPGSYYLTGDLAVPSGKNGILVATSSVTIDLNGFSISGGTGSRRAITTDGVYWTGIAVKNGSVNGCAMGGVDLSTVWDARISNVIAVANSGYGISTGFGAIVDHCTSSSNSGGGFHSAGETKFSLCSSISDSFGFVAEGDDTIDSCSATYEDNYGIYAMHSTTITNCTVAHNEEQGIISLGYHSTISHNQIRENGGSNAAGLWVQGGENRIEGNDVVGNGYGIYVSGTQNLVIGNTAASSHFGNYYIILGNHVGTILTPNSNGSLINGNSGGGLGTNDPNANFVY